MRVPIILRALAVAVLAAVVLAYVLVMQVMPIQAEDQKPSVDIVPKSKVPLDVLTKPPASVPATKPPQTPGDGKQDTPAGEILKNPQMDIAKGATPPAKETRPLCGAPRDPWTECKNGELLQCTQTLSQFGPKVCNYHERCVNSGRRC
jgi:hypothetical protein